MRQTTEKVTEITKMFTKRALFYPEFVALEQAQMTRYLSMLKTDIRQFVYTHRYASLAELQDDARRREIEIEIKAKELRQAPIQS